MMQSAREVLAVIGSMLMLCSCSVTPPQAPPAVKATPAPPVESRVEPAPPELHVTASSVQEDNTAYRPENVLDGNPATRWSSEFSDPQWLQIDLGDARELSGVELQWEAAHAKAYQVLLSLDGTNWSTVHDTAAGGGGTDAIAFEKRPARFVKIVGTQRGTEFGYSLVEVVLKGADGRPLPEAFLPTLQKFYEFAARRSPGCYPRWLSNRQAFWTVVGVADDDKESILCEDGTIEHHKRGYTLMPLLFVGGRLVSRDQAEVSQSLENQHLPIPSVHWRCTNGPAMDITMFAHGPAGESSAYTRYTIRNDTATNLACRLFLLLRPFQLYPPWQGEGEGENEEEGKGLGGMSRITSVRRTAAGVQVNGKYRIDLPTPPDGFGTQAGHPPLRAPFRDPLVDGLQDGRLPSGGDADDPDGGVSGVLAYDLNLTPGGSKDVFVAMPLHAGEPQLSAAMDDAAVARGFRQMLAETAAYWESKVSRLELDIPEPGFVETLKANIGYSFVTKDGPWLQPGSWCYDKAWIRDGSIAALAFMRLGFMKEAKEFLDVYRGHQFASGEIPCVVDNKAKDPYWERISEYDSQGEYVSAVLHYYRFTGDQAFLQDHFTNVVRALQFAQSLRDRRTTPEYANDPQKKLMFGLISKSYANHNYFDNLWTLKAWKDGEAIARLLGQDDAAGWMAAQYKALRESVYRSMEGAMAAHGIDYIPEYPEGTHFWPASIGAGVVYCDEAQNMPQPALQRTFDKYYDQLVEWKKPGAEYRFTPEEMPMVEGFLRLDQPDRAIDFLRFMLDHRKPTGWKQWPEVVNSDERRPTIFGDMPHTWVSAQYINALASLFAYEQGDTLVVGHGIPPEWAAAPDGVAVRGLHTHFGRIGYRVKAVGGTVTVQFEGDARPPGGLALRLPGLKPLAAVSVDGVPWTEFSGREVRLPGLPAQVVLSYE